MQAEADRCGTSSSQRSATCAHEAHIGIGASVPKLGPKSINRQPTPTKEPIKTGLKS